MAPDQNGFDIPKDSKLSPWEQFTCLAIIREWTPEQQVAMLWAFIDQVGRKMDCVDFCNQVTDDQVERWCGPEEK